jgi:hypothetical protein
MPFPQRQRPFPAPGDFVPRARGEEDFVTASLASIPRRVRGLSAVVRSLLPQVDRLCVYLNNYEDVPAFLNNPKIQVARSQDHGDLRDNGKFFFMDESSPGYRFTVDDDIHYPPDYVAYCLAKLQQYDQGAVVGFHGRILPPVVSRFFNREDTQVFSFDRSLVADRQVHVLGTGTVAYHSTALRIGLRDFETTGMADLWFAAHAQEQHVPMIAVARPAGFLRGIAGLDERTLWNEYKDRDDAQTRIAQRYQPWGLPELQAAIGQVRGP